MSGRVSDAVMPDACPPSGVGPWAKSALACYLLISVVHVFFITTESSFAYPTKLMLMPVLAVTAALLALRFRVWQLSPHTVVLLLAGILLSWFGDGAAFFFPGLPELPMMLACFGAAHLCYIAVIWGTRVIPRPGVPQWAWVYAAVYVVLVVVLWPYAGSLQLPVAVYGLLLVATAVMTARCGAVVAWGGAWFLLSDAVLSLRVFLPEMMPDWTEVFVMLSYTLGQGLIVCGILMRLQRREALLRPR